MRGFESNRAGHSSNYQNRRAGPFSEPEGHVLPAQVEEAQRTKAWVETAERSETMEHPHSADATPSGHAVAVGRTIPETAALTCLDPQDPELPSPACFVPGFVPHAGLRAHPLPIGNRSPAPGTADSDPRAERNHQNAAHSTGPRTPEGKAASSRNALKHGLSIQRHAILEHEDPADYAQLLAELRGIYEPQSRREDLSVEDIAQCRWALRRFDKGEATLLEYHFARDTDTAMTSDDPIHYGESLGYSCLQEPGETRPEYPSFLLLQRYRGHWDRRHQRALAEFDHAQRARRQEAREERQRLESERKFEREAQAERRREELHELKVALAQTKLAEAQARTSAKQAKSDEAAFFQALERHLQAPPPGLAEDELAALGFVSSEQSKPTPGPEITACNHGSQAA